MDYHFPKQLFPTFYNIGPPDQTRRPICGGTWGTYGRLMPQGVSGSKWTFASRHRTKGDTWYHTEPVAIPLFTPQKSLWSTTRPHLSDFHEQMQNFYSDHVQDAIGCTNRLFSEGLGSELSEGVTKGSALSFLKDFRKNPELETSGGKFKFPKFKPCTNLLSGLVSDIPPELLGTLLYEELTEQGSQKQFSEKATGGALAFIPFAEGGDSERGCLLYAGGQGLDQLNFRRVALQCGETSSFLLDASSDPCTVQIQAPIRQISAASPSNEHCVAVRSDYLYGVWKYSENSEPCLLGVMNSEENATCISASPHVLGEVLVANEGGSAHLWIAGKRMQKVREENDNLYFNANSPWRWCEFSAHPRVMTYADRTGAELTDMRVSADSHQSLFRISRTSDCRAGERLITCRYLSDAHPFHHLVTTQYSAYLLDERFACVPMLKMDHLMTSPPMFCHVSSGVGTTLVLLGSQSSQEMTLLQYSGGRMEASTSRGPPQALLTPGDSLKQLPLLVPKQQSIASDRLSSAASGLTRVQLKPSGGRASGCLCVAQLTEDGDIFYQTLSLRESDSTSSPSRCETVSYASQTQSTVASQLEETVSETSSDEDIIGPSQPARHQRFVSAFPVRIQESSSSSDCSSEDSHSLRKRRYLKRFRGLEVVANLDPDLAQVSDSDDQEEEGKNDARTSDALDATSRAHTSSSGHADRQTDSKPSDRSISTWRDWLQNLVELEPKVQHTPFYMLREKVTTENLLTLSEHKIKALSKKLDLPRLKNELMDSMVNRSMLVNHSPVVPFPNMVDTNDWHDHLSERLTLSWQGEAAWKEWWRDHLGLNRDEKREALRRKRKKEKAAKRASGLTPSLSDSFSSSYITDQEYLSDSSSWYSQKAFSDAEEQEFHSQSFLSEELMTPPASQSDSVGCVAPTTPQHSTRQPDTPASPGISFDSCMTSERSALPHRFDRVSQGSPTVTDAPQSSTVDPPLTSSQASSAGIWASQSLSDFSQSISQSLSQSSQRRTRTPRGSQPKKSRMGF